MTKLTVETLQRFFIQVIEFEDEMFPTQIFNVKTHLEAIEAFLPDFLEQMEGEWTSGPVKVWQEGKGFISELRVFDVEAVIVPYTGADTDEGEVTCNVEVTERIV